MLDNLPIEIITKILLRLPVKTLIKCTILSKFYISLITGREFINTHIAENCNTHLFLRYFTGDDEKEKYHLEPDSHNFTGFQTQELLPPFPNFDFCSTVAGCVDGVLCLVNDFHCEGTVIILWNPSIRKYVLVPRTRYVLKSYDENESACGFGFDSVSNDYKVVRVVDLGPSFHATEVEVYSLRSGCWRTVGAGPKYRMYRKHEYIPCFLHGCVHWVGSHRVSSTIFENVLLKFDMSVESFEIMEVPSMLKECQGEYAPIINIGLLECNGMLTLVSRNYSDAHRTCTFWLLKDYEVVNSWTKMFEFEYGDVYSFHMLSWCCFRKNGEFIIVKDKNYGDENRDVIVSFDLVARSETILGELTAKHVDPFSFYLFPYVESMILFKEGKTIEDGTQVML